MGEIKRRENLPDISPQEVVSTPKNNFDRLPEKPGVYILKNAEGTPVYVGKATSIKGRVLAHLRSKIDDPIGRDLERPDSQRGLYLYALTA